MDVRVKAWVAALVITSAFVVNAIAPCWADAASSGAEKWAMVNADVRPDGTIAGASLENSSGDKNFDAKAIAAVRSWQLRPHAPDSLIKGNIEPVIVWVAFPSNKPKKDGCPWGPFDKDQPDTISVSDFRITGDATDDPLHTIYAKVRTKGCGEAKLVLTWTYENTKQLVSRELDWVIGQGNPVLTAFNVRLPTSWPLGRYKVDLKVNDVAAGSREFVIDAHGLAQ